MAVNDLAGAATHGPYVPEQLLAGDKPIKTAAAPVLTANIAKYDLIAIRPTGVIAFVWGTDTAANAALAMQPAVVGAQCPYAYEGVFNDAIINYGTPTSIGDTFAERRAYFTGLFRVDHLYPSA